MATQKTRWTPDTCGCVVDLEWDDAQPETARTHRMAVVRTCHAHAAQADAPAVVTAENQRKNQALQALAADFPGVAIPWRFDETRQLRITLPRDAAPQTRTRLAAALLIAHGGRVKVE